MAVCLEPETSASKQLRNFATRKICRESSNYLQNSSAEKCSFQNVPDGALVNDIQYVTFRPFVEEQSAKTMNHHLGRAEMNLLWLSHWTIPSSFFTHPDDKLIDVFSGII